MVTNGAALVPVNPARFVPVGIPGRRMGIDPAGVALELLRALEEGPYTAHAHHRRNVGGARTGESRPRRAHPRARAALGRSIAQHINGMAGELPVITAGVSLEQILQQTVQAACGSGAGIEPRLAERLHQLSARQARRQEAASRAALRPGWPARCSTAFRGPQASAYSEVPDHKQIQSGDQCRAAAFRPGCGLNGRTFGGQRTQTRRPRSERWRAHGNKAIFCARHAPGHSPSAR